MKEDSKGARITMIKVTHAYFQIKRPILKILMGVWLLIWTAEDPTWVLIPVQEAFNVLKTF